MNGFMKKIKRPVIHVESSCQVEMFVPENDVKQATAAPPGKDAVRFKDSDPRDIYLGSLCIETHLSKAGIVAPSLIRQLLSELDWSDFKCKYQAGGRPPYHPRLMMGMILYGIAKGVSSLRGLEELARTDLGCMWIGGGICPDHSIFGRFINKHRVQITGDFFMSVTRQVLERTGSDCESVAGDGTVVQAAASRFGLIKQEAARQAQHDAERSAKENPDDPEMQRKKEVADEVAKTLHRRREARRKKGKPFDHVKVSRTEPQAMHQPLKTKQRAPSYKASILANEKRIVVAAAVNPSSETKAVKPMMEDVKKLSGQMPRQGMFDAGYHGQEVIDVAMENNMDLLCPAGRTNNNGSEKKSTSKHFPKSKFVYDDQSDLYRCPAGEVLKPTEHRRGNSTEPGYVRYGTKSCAGCQLRDGCTKSAGGRKIKRYAVDEKKEALRQVMEQKGAQLRYLKRQAMVEPVFSELRYRQGLMRFRRKGTDAVRLEFFLHVSAHNLRRAAAVLSVVFLRLWLATRRYCSVYVPPPLVTASRRRSPPPGGRRFLS